MLPRYPALYASWRVAAAAAGAFAVVGAFFAAALFPRRPLEKAAAAADDHGRGDAPPPRGCGALVALRGAARGAEPGAGALVGAYVFFHAAMDVKATYLTAYFDDAWPAKASLTATLNATCLVPVSRPARHHGTFPSTYTCPPPWT